MEVEGGGFSFFEEADGGDVDVDSSFDYFVGG